MVSKAFLPSLSLSSSAKIINVSSDFASIAGEFVLPCTIFAAVVQPHQLGCIAQLPRLFPLVLVDLEPLTWRRKYWRERIL